MNRRRIADKIGLRRSQRRTRQPRREAWMKLGVIEMIVLEVESVTERIVAEIGGMMLPSAFRADPCNET